MQTILLYSYESSQQTDLQKTIGLENDYLLLIGHHQMQDWPVINQSSIEGNFAL